MIFGAGGSGLAGGAAFTTDAEAEAAHYSRTAEAGDGAGREGANRLPPDMEEEMQSALAFVVAGLHCGGAAT